MKNDKEILTSIQDVKLPLSVKIGYSVGNFAKALLAVSTAAFLTFFYVDVCGMNKNIAASIVLIAKIWDIINDPMMGAIVDKTKSKEGKCRVYLKYFSVPTGIIFALTFFMPNFVMKGKVIWAAATYVLQGMLSTVLLIPLNTLMGRLTANDQQKMHMSQFGNAFSMVGSMLVSGYMMKIARVTGGGNMVKGFACAGAIFAFFYIVCHLIVFFSTKGYEPLEQYAPKNEVVTAQNSQPDTLNKISLKVRLGALLKNGMWLSIVLMNLLLNLSMSMENAALPFYLQYNHPENMDLLYSLFSTVGLVLPSIVIVTANILTKKLGVTKTAIVGSAIALSGYVFRLIVHDASPLLISIGWGLYQFGVTFVNVVILLLIFISQEYGFKKTGIDNEAILMSGFSVSYKTGMAIGGAILGYMIPASYVAGAEVQTEQTLNFFFNSSTLYPAIFSAICLLMCVIIYIQERNMKNGKFDKVVAGSNDTDM